MQSTLFEISTAGTFNSHYLAEVVSVQDPLNLARVQVRLYNFDGVDNQDAAIWARVAVPFAGANRGAFLLPDVGDEVLINFVNGDSRWPIVVGSLWNGNARAPERLGGDRVDRWSLVGKAGTRIAIVEENAATISFETPSGVSGTLSDAGGGKIEFQAAGTTITVDSAGVSIQTPGKLTVSASQIEINAGATTVNTITAEFSDVVMCNSLQTTSVIAKTYTPGAGNVW